MAIQKNIVATEQYVADRLQKNQADWSQSDSSAFNYVKNRTHYDDTESGGELKKLDNKYLNDNVVTCQSAEIGQIIVVKSVNEDGVPIEWEAVKGQTSQNVLTLKDVSTGLDYWVYVKDGSLESRTKTTSIKVTTLPSKTDYTDTELFDPTGMVIVSIGQDGNEIEITDYTYDEYVTTGSNVHEIRYVDLLGVAYTVEIPIITKSIKVALQDFTYITNDDGTYTITGWKETLNSEPSTRMVVPNSELVIV